MQSPFVIGVTGGSGSGKSTFLIEMRKRFSESELCVFPQDNYYLKREKQSYDEKGVQNFDRLESIDLKKFEEDLFSLIDGEDVHVQEYVYNNSDREPQDLLFRPAPVILAEGLFVFANKKIHQRLDLRVFIYAQEIKKVIRRIKRDGVERNYPLDDVLYRYEHHVLPSFEEHIRPMMQLADIIVNNNDSMDRALDMFEILIRHHTMS